MSDSPFPETLPLFPLREAALLPRARLPLNIFEPRYLAMTEYALGHQRLIGMIRPREDDEIEPPLYDVGCAGRIVSFEETGDGRYLIELVGVSRFWLKREHLTEENFRLGEVDWSPFAGDRDPSEVDTDSLRENLLLRLADYLHGAGLSADWNTIESASTETVVNSVVMSCPFDADEKQALLEAADLTDRIRVLMTLMEIALAEMNDTDGSDGSGHLQ